CRTLHELRRYWKYYADFRDLPASRIDKLRQQHSKLFEFLRKDFTNNLSPSRSAGLLWLDAITPMNNLFVEYWKNGTTSARADDIKDAVNLNPTFVYSASGEVFGPHSGTFPEGFHLAPAFVPIASDPMQSGVPDAKSSPMDVSKRQFRAYSTTPDLLNSEWHATRVHLDQLSAGVPTAPTKFDVIDTSNLANHVGLLHILLVTRPLLKDNPISKSVLYTEEIKDHNEVAAYPFLDRLCTSIPTLAALLGLAPLDYLSGFTTHSSVHEILHGVSRRLERVTWVDRPVGTVTATRTAKILFNGQDVPTLMNQPTLSMFQMRQSSQYHPDSVAILFQLVKRRIHLKTGTWDTVVEMFLEVVASGPGRPFEPEKLQELCLLLHLHGVYTADPLQPDCTRFLGQPLSGVFKDWHDIPPVLCVVLTVPGKRVRNILGKDASPLSTIALQCTFRTGRPLGHVFSSIRCIWGMCTAGSDPETMILAEDPRGANGESNLVVSFWVPSHLLVYKAKTVEFGLMPTPDAIKTFTRKLTESLEVFTTRLDDGEHVKILSYRPPLASEDRPKAQPTITCFPDPASSNDRIQLSADVGETNNQHSVISFTARVEIDDSVEQQVLLARTDPSVVQVSPCSVKLSIDQFEHIVSYPYPILGNHMPLVNVEDRERLTWLDHHTALQSSDRQRRIMSGQSGVETPNSKQLAAVKSTIESIANLFAGTWGEKETVFGLCEPTNSDSLYAVLLVGGIRLDLASFTMVIDVAVVSAVSPFLAKLEKTQKVLYQLDSRNGEATVWKRLIPAFIERARTWKHTTNCEYVSSGQIPVSLDLGGDILCSCGAGVGFEADEWKDPAWKALLPFATRAAISPLFSVPYVESIALTVKQVQGGMLGEPLGEGQATGWKETPVCWACGGPGKPELLGSMEGLARVQQESRARKQPVVLESRANWRTLES
ncbi:hypothetical protein FRC10_006399, partial [Ceratobasidium sp. 414]